MSVKVAFKNVIKLTTHAGIILVELSAIRYVQLKCSDTQLHTLRELHSSVLFGWSKSKKDMG